MVKTGVISRDFPLAHIGIIRTTQGRKTNAIGGTLLLVGGVGMFGGGLAGTIDNFSLKGKTASSSYIVVAVAGVPIAIIGAVILATSNKSHSFYNRESKLDIITVTKE